MSANTDKSALQVALKSKFTDIATKLGIDLSGYADADFTNPDKMTTLLQTINDKISADSGSGENSQQALDDHLTDLVALANLMKITVDTGTLADGSKLPADSFTLPATAKKIADVQYVVSQGTSDLQKQVTALQSAMDQLKLPIDLNDPNVTPAQAVINAVNAVIQDTQTKVVAQVTDLVNSIGVDVSWLNYGPEYHAIDNPQTLFGASPSAQVNSIKASDKNGNTVNIMLPMIYGGGGINNPLIWTGFGWLIYNSSTSQVYTEKTESDANGNPVAAGVGWVDTTKLFEQITLPDGQKRVILWGSAGRQFVKAFVPDFSEIDTGQGMLSWNGDVATYTKNDGSAKYGFNFLPNADGVTGDALNNYYAFHASDFISTGTKSQPVSIQKTSIFVKQ